MNKWIMVFLILFVACMQNKHKSYWRIDKIQITPIKQNETRGFFVYSYCDSFSISSTDINMVFSVDEITFIDSESKDVDQNLPYAGNMGSFSNLRSLGLSIMNAKYTTYKDITNTINFSSYFQQGVTFLLNPKEVIDVNIESYTSINYKEMWTLGSFDNFKRLVNARDSSLQYRSLLRTDLFVKPFVLFNFPISHCAPGENKILLTINFDDYTLKAQKTIVIKE